LGQLAVRRHFSSGIDWAIAGAATAVAAKPPPAAFRNSRRFIAFPLLFLPIVRRLGKTIIRTSSSPVADDQHAIIERNPAQGSLFGRVAANLRADLEGGPTPNEKPRGFESPGAILLQCRCDQVLERARIM
jgi:hypothetical protein